MYTSHGYWIPGTSKDETPLAATIDCGGISMCSLCKSEMRSYMYRDTDFSDLIMNLVRKHVTARRDDALRPIDWSKHRVTIMTMTRLSDSWTTDVYTTVDGNRLYKVYMAQPDNRIYISEYLLAVNRLVSADGLDD